MTTIAAADAALRVPTSPYKGLVPYAAEDAPFFFGRDEWREIIIDNLRAYRLTLLYGASGIGKSSVLHAGVLHDLHDRAQRTAADTGKPGLVIVAFRTWREDPLGALVRSLREATDAVLGEQTTTVDAEAKPDLAAALEESARRVAGKVFVVLDQFEEYFLYHAREDDGDPFGQAFVEAVNRRDLRASFLISIREDAVAKLDRFKGQVPSLFDNYLRIDQLNREEAREAIEKPLEEYARRAGRRITIEPRLVEAVLDEVQTGKVIVGQTGAGIVEDASTHHSGQIETPYLQLVLTRLWDEEVRTRSETLRLGTFKRLGGAEGIVRTHLDAAMSALSPADQDTAAQLFNHLVTPSGSKIAQTASDLASYAELPDTASVTAILERLSGEVRILRPVGEDSYEIYHDALAAPILDWRARWHAGQSRRREHRRTQLYGAVALISVVVAAILITAWVRANNATDRAVRSENKVKRTTSATLADSALLELDRSPAKAARLAMKAYETAPTARAAAALRAVASSNLTAVMSGPDHQVVGTAFSPDGRFVATVDDGGDTRISTVPSGRTVATLRNSDRAGGQIHELPVDPVFSPDGAILVTPGPHGVTRVWDARNWRPITRLGGHPGPVLSVAFSRDGSRLVTAGDDGTARVRDVSTWRSVAVLRARRDGAVQSAALSPDGALVALVEPDSAVSVWRFAPTRRIAVLHDPRRPLNFAFVPNVSVAFSRDGRLLLSVGDDGRARMWHVAQRRRIMTVTDTKGGAINSAAFSPDGKRFVATADDGTAVIRESAKPGRPLATFRLGKEVSIGAFSRDGRMIVAAGEKGTISVWDPQRPSRPTATLTARSQTGFVWSASFSRSGRHIVAAGNDGVARLLDTRAVPPVLTLPRQRGSVLSAHFSPDGRHIVTTAEDGAVRVWRTDDGRSVLVVRGPREFRGGVGTATPTTRDAGFSRDSGRLLILASSGATVWGTRSWRQLGELPAHRSSKQQDTDFNGVLSPDGTRVATWDFRSQVWVRDAATGVIAGRLNHSGEVSFTPDGTRIFTPLDGSRAPKFWSSRDLRPVSSPLGAQGAPGGLKYSPDGRLLATSDGNRQPRVWNARTGRLAATLGAGGASFYSFSPDSSRILVMRDNRTTEIWGVKPAKNPLATVREPVIGPAPFSPDGRFVIAYNRGSASIADAATGQLFARLPGKVSSVAFSPTTMRIAAGGEDGVLRIYSCVACVGDKRLLELVARRLR